MPSSLACRWAQTSYEELALAKTQLLSQMRAMLDNAYRLEEFYVGQAVAGRNETIEDLLAAISHTTKQEVVEAAQSIREDTVFFLKGVSS